nr:protein ABCI7, chloroplastic [Ipomoea batatas]
MRRLPGVVAVECDCSLSATVANHFLHNLNAENYSYDGESVVSTYASRCSKPCKRDTASEYDGMGGLSIAVVKDSYLCPRLASKEYTFVLSVSVPIIHPRKRRSSLRHLRSSPSSHITTFKGSFQTRERNNANHHPDGDLPECWPIAKPAVHRRPQPEPDVAASSTGPSAKRSRATAFCRRATPPFPSLIVGSRRGRTKSPEQIRRGESKRLFDGWQLVKSIQGQSYLQAVAQVGCMWVAMLDHAKVTGHIEKSVCAYVLVFQGDLVLALNVGGSDKEFKNLCPIFKTQEVLGDGGEGRGGGKVTHSYISNQSLNAATYLSGLGFNRHNIHIQGKYGSDTVTELSTFSFVCQLGSNTRSTTGQAVFDGNVQGEQAQINNVPSMRIVIGSVSATTIHEELSPSGGHTRRRRSSRDVPGNPREDQAVAVLLGWVQVGRKYLIEGLDKSHSARASCSHSGKLSSVRDDEDNHS